MAKDFNNMSLEELDFEDLNYFVMHRQNGGKHESDHSINEISRARIAAFNKDNGQAFLVKHHISFDQTFDPAKIFVPYTGQKIHNFEYDYVVPIKDTVLEGIISRIHSENEAALFVIPPNATDRVIEIGGIYLTWV